MTENNSGLTFDIIWSINTITEDTWNNLFGEEIIEGYGYQKSLEESRLKEFSFGYCLLRRKEKITGIVPFFIMDFSFDILLPDILRPAIARLQKIFPRFLKMKIVFLGTPTAEDFYLRLAKSEDLNAAMDLALSKIRSFARQEKIPAIAFHNLSLKNRALIDYLKRKCFIEMETLPTTSLTVTALSWKEYLSSLSKNARKDLKKKLRKSSGLTTLTTELREDITDICTEVYKLYLNNFLDSDIHFEILTPEFFLNISRNMPNVAKFFITSDKEKIVAFNLCLIKNNTCIDKFIGFDPDAAYRYHLYFTTFYHNINWCIKNNIRYYQLGVSDYYPKVRLGAKIIPLYIYAEVLHPIARIIIKSTIKFIEPKKTDSYLNAHPIKND